MAFGRKRAPKEAPQQQSAPQQSGNAGSAPWQSYGGSAGYQVTEVPYYDKGKRCSVVYISDDTGKVIRCFKK